MKLYINNLLALVIVSATIITGCTDNSQKQLNLNIQAAQYLNPDSRGIASPIVISLYQLKSASPFNQSRFQQLTANPANTLGEQLIDKQSLEIRPGSKQFIRQYVSKQCHYLGITAAYRSLVNHNWRKIIRLPVNQGASKILISLQAQSLEASINQ